MSNQRCWTFGDNIDTDQIMPSQYLVLPPEEMCKHVMEPQSKNFAADFQPGEFIVAGHNFGCGSSREQAPLALKVAGAQAIIARSFAQIFYRNAINLGLPIVEVAEAAEIQDGDRLSIDLTGGTLTNHTQDKTYRFAPIEGLPRNIIDAGGLLAYLKEAS